MGLDQHKVQDTKYSTRDKTLKAQVSAGCRTWSLTYPSKRTLTILNGWRNMTLPIVVFIGLVIGIELVAAWSHLP